MENLKCLIVDDEHLARTLLTDYISKVPFLELTGVCKNAMEALAFLQQNKIDVLFLDINMPGFTGIELLKSTAVKPLVILTTAYAEYAVESYELQVFEYLLKPIKFARFVQAANKAKDYYFLKDNITPGVAQESQIQSFKKKYLTVKADYKIYKLNFEELVYVEGMREYVTFHMTNKDVLALASLRSLEENLPPDQFIRIHKSYIVSIDKIDALEGNQIEIGSLQLPVGKSYKEKLMKIFND